jgi:hypothetical protein
MYRGADARGPGVSDNDARRQPSAVRRILDALREGLEEMAATPHVWCTYYWRPPKQSGEDNTDNTQNAQEENISPIVESARRRKPFRG